VTDKDTAFVARLRAGDEAAYTILVRRYHMMFVRLARVFCRVQATAEEVVQDAWVAVVSSIHSYGGEVPIKAWISAIVVNKARTRAVRDSRIRVFSDFVSDGEDAGGECSNYEMVLPNGARSDRPLPWNGITPEREVAGRQLMEHLSVAVDDLPPAQRAVVLLRDVEGLEPGEICQVLGITDAHQRVLRHRARTRLRALLDDLVTPAPMRG